LVTVADTERVAIYAELNAMVTNMAVVVPLLHPDVVRFVRTGVQGLRADPMNMLDLRRVRKN
jgi:peptide/nickel transport system substrate-binding protein